MTTGSAERSPTADVSGTRPLPFVLLYAAQFMLIVDVVVATVALPAMQGDLGIGPADAQWVIAAYSLAFGGFMVSAGRAADLFGAKRILLAGLGIFTVASLVSGLALSGVMLFAGRALQGFGAALVAPAILTLITTTLPEGHARNRAMGILGAVGSAGAVAGYVVGGVLTDLVHWRAIFLINLPIALVAGIGVLRRIPADRPSHAGRTDVGGAVLLTAGVVLAVTAISRAEGGLSTVVVLSGLAGLLLLVGFVAVEQVVSRPMVRLSMFANRNLRYGNVIGLLSAAAAMVASVFSMLYMQRVLGLTPLLAGLGSAPVTLAILFVASKAGAMVSRFGVRRLLLASAFLLALGLALLSLATPDGSYWVNVLPGLLIAGVGAGVGLTPAMIAATTDVAAEDQGLAAGLIGTAQQIGGALGLAILNTVVVAAATAATASGQVEAAALTSGYAAGFRWGLIIPVLIGLCVAALPSRRERVT